MANNTLVRNPVTLWVNADAGSPVLNSELAKFEDNAQKQINGDDGGAYAPSGPIIVNGPGIVCAVPLIVTLGGVCQSGAFAHEDGDWAELSADHEGRTLRRLFSWAHARVSPRYAGRVRREDGALQMLAASVDASDGLGPQTLRAYNAFRAHDGSTIKVVTLSYRFAVAHIPSVPQKARVLRMDANGVCTALTSPAAGADADGFVTFVAPTSVADSVKVQTLAIPCDENNVVDIAAYDYLVEFLEEGDAKDYPLALVFKQSVKAASTGNLAGAGLGAVDGYTPSDGDRILRKDQTDPTQNGIWIAHSGAWTRALDLDEDKDFSVGFCVRVEQGNANGASMWQSKSSTTKWTRGDRPPGVATWATGTAYGVGTYIVPTASHATGLYYQALSISGSGTSGGTEPAWVTTIGQDIIDNVGANQIIWSCIGKLDTALSFVTRADRNDPPEGSALLQHGTILFPMLVEFGEIADTRWS